MKGWDEVSQPEMKFLLRDPNNYLTYLGREQSQQKHCDYATKIVAVIHDVSETTMNHDDIATTPGR
jgi:hypothetical protein